MKQLRQLGICFLVMILVISSTFVSSAESRNDKANQNVSFESFKLEDINNHPDVIQFLLSNDAGFSADAIIEQRINEIDSTPKIISTEGGEILFSQSEQIRVAKQYKIQTPNYQNSLMCDVLVERDNRKSNLSDNQMQVAASITSVWYFYYNVSSSGFTVNLIITSGSLDSVSGTINQFGLSGNTWLPMSTETFSKSNAGSGQVYKWTVAPYYVKERFNYSIAVVDEGVSYTFNNTGVVNLSRYNFTAGPFSSISANGGERHHFVSANSLTSAGFPSGSFPAIRMIQADHYLTPNWGPAGAAFRANELSLLRISSFESCLQMEVDTLQMIADPDGNYSNLQTKYYDQVIVCLYLAEIYFGIN